MLLFLAFLSTKNAFVKTTEHYLTESPPPFPYSLEQMAVGGRVERRLTNWSLQHQHKRTPRPSFSPSFPTRTDATSQRSIR